MSFQLTERATKLIALLQSEGFTSVHDFLKARGFQAFVPGICRSKRCDATKDVLPDERAGWCDECGTESIVSVLVLADVV